ncbi:UV excision repair protein Rad23 [Hesseltinella vesiculosa]|uniref:UV excision repair protein RAD23 n=1 Tax=Hesseltinella vesiculosa TaxID=101127 RepID=A0A1X2GBT0_9FUNG|nr:UV excision repair protein Rad23 [Hesseltinella vesiculosa]
MKLTVKTLHKEALTLEAEPTDTILSVKEQIEQLKGDPVDSQKLIFSGKILDNAKTIEQYDISEKDFLVVMVAKKKPVKPAAEASKPKEEPKPVKEEEPAASTATPTDVTSAAAPSTTPAADTNTSGDNQLLTGNALEPVIQNMMELGFEREQIQRALRASFNNPDRAVEYLYNGIPESIEREFQERSEAAAQDSTELASEPESAPPSNQPQNLFHAAAQQGQQQQRPNVDFSQLSQTPHFQQLRQLVQSNPAMLQPLLQQIGASNPELLSVINADPHGFLSALTGEAGEGDEGEGAIPQGSQVIQVTQEEKEAIDRLEQLGVDRAIAIEAYFACDKNEELAANYIFEHQNFD